MKVIPLSEAEANLSRYGDLCHEEPVIVTVDGIPSFQLVPVVENDEIVDQLLEQNPKFRALMAQRLAEPALSVEEALRRL